MASYHLTAKMIGRSAGKSAIGAAAYRSGGVLTCPETGEVFDYSRKGGILDAFIIAPEMAPAWATDRQALWTAVHAKETRKNSQLSREIEVALPHELTATEGAQLVSDWVRDTFAAEGMVADVAIHDPDLRGDEYHPNRHAHIMLTTREIDETRPDGWASNKCRAWNDAATLESWRESWANAQNAAFEARGLSVRVDHRSLEDQQAAAKARGDEIAALVLSRDPEPRLGLAAGGLEAKGQRTDRGNDLREAREHRARLHQLADDIRAADAEIEAATVEIEVTEAMSILSMPIEIPTPAPEEPDMEHDRTKTAVERQLKGMGLTQVEISITGIDRPSVQTMTPAEIVADLPRLKRLNKAGGNIYIRGPRDQDHDLVLLDDIDAFTPKKMEADGLKPAVVVETSPGNFQAWIKLHQPEPAGVRREAAFILAERYGGDLGAADGHQSGRLAGFTNAKPVHKTSRGSPFVLLTTYAGRIASAARDLISAARVAFAEKSAEKAKSRDMITPAPDADADLVRWFQQGHAAAPTGTSLSEIDWHLTHRALASGRTAEDVAAALEAVSDRKEDHAAGYAVTTVSKAVAARQGYTPPTEDDDTPSPF